MKFGLGDLSEEEQLEISDVDDALLYYEFIALKETPPVSGLPPEISMEHDFSQRDFDTVENEFIDIFKLLTNG